MTANTRRIHQHWSVRDVVHRVLDAACIVGGSLAGLRLTGVPVGERHLMAAASAVIIFYLTAEISGMYRNWRGVSTEREILCAASTWGFSLLFLSALARIIRR